ncbi:MAG: YCF48-related protein [Ignavibacteria bacterium]|nr:YCF48-related protein [Ignavibacteria bacterium]
MKPTIIIAVLINCIIAAQVPDTTKDKPVQYRRGIELQEGYQTYKEKYSGKDLEEIKRSLFPLRSTGVWTELNPKVPRVNYLGLHFVNKDTGWAVGGSGAIIKTTNGGEDWAIAETPVTNLLLKIHSYNGQTVIATGYDGLILRSTDGGKNFVQVTSGVGTGIDLWGVQMVNDTLGWICGLYNTLLKTTDGGLTWQSVTAGLSQHYWSLSFLNENFGMIACGGGNILKTIDGGTNWLQIQAGDDRTLYSIDVVDSLHVAAAGERRLEIQYEGGKNVYSSDGGATWIMNDDIPTYTDANWIEFVNKDTGYTINVNKGIYKTTNRGQSWAFVGGGGDWHIDMIGNAGYAGGNGLNIYKRTEGLENWSKIILNDNFNDVHFINETTGFALSEYLYKTVNSGINWTRIDNAPGGNDIIFLDGLVGFIAGKYKTTNGGETWYPINGGGTKIFFVNDSVGWSIDNRILKTIDRGESWIVQQTASNFTSIYFVDSLYGWASRINGRPFKTTDSGTNWIQQTNLDLWQTNDIYFANSDTGWITDVFEGLSKTTNSGINWVNISGMYQPRKFVLFPLNNRFWVYGFSHIYETTNNGETWEEITPSIPVFSKFHALESYIGWGIGGIGYIVKYFDSSYVPVELTSFGGNIQNNKIILNWQTASELNNKGFYIEKSFDKIIWKEIGFKNGNGTTTENNFYSFIDSEINSTLQYYRLKQVDFNGKFEYSKVVCVETYLINKNFILFQNYPNPFNSSTVITYQVPEKSFINISMYNVIGEKVHEIVNVEKDEGIFKEIFISEQIPSGVYFLRMKTSAGFSAINKITLIK